MSVFLIIKHYHLSNLRKMKFIYCIYAQFKAAYKSEIDNPPIADNALAFSRMYIVHVYNYHILNIFQPTTHCSVKAKQTLFAFITSFAYESIERILTLRIGNAKFIRAHFYCFVFKHTPPHIAYKTRMYRILKLSSGLLLSFLAHNIFI